MLRCFSSKQTLTKVRTLNMRARKLCHKLLSFTSIHKKRIAVISEVIETILTSKSIAVTQIGRKLKNNSQTRSNIRKVDRLYSNQHLMYEGDIIAKELAKYLLRNERPLVAIDGSKIPNSPWYILSASLVVNGRGITLYEKIYESSNQRNPNLYKKFLLGLKSILPKTTVPILITDAEFQRSWFEMVDNLGWDYIGRVRGDKYISINDEDFESIHDIFECASNKPKALGYGFLNVQQEYLGYFYLYKYKNKGRHAHTRTGCHSETEKSVRIAKSCHEPWLLFSSLDLPAKQIIKAYAYRMTIEENFRDMKSGRYGLGLEMTYSKSKCRYKIMLILARLAAIIAYLIGYVGEIKGCERKFQSCSTRNKRMLSRFFLGCELIYKEWSFKWSEIKLATQMLQKELYASFKA